MKIFIWMMVILGASIGEADKDCDIQWTTSGEGAVVKVFPMKNEQMRIWYKALENSSATLKIKEEGKERRSFSETWTLLEQDPWKIMTLKKARPDEGGFRAIVVIPGRFPNGEYTTFEKVSAVEVSSTGMVLWSSCDVSSHPVCSIPDNFCPKETDETPVDYQLTLSPVVVATAAAVVVFLIIVIIVLISYIVRDRKQQCTSQAQPNPSSRRAIVQASPDSPRDLKDISVADSDCRGKGNKDSKFDDDIQSLGNLAEGKYLHAASIDSLTDIQDNHIEMSSVCKKEPLAG